MLRNSIISQAEKAPPKDPQINIRVPYDSYCRVTEAAKKHGQTPTQFCRDAALAASDLVHPPALDSAITAVQNIVRDLYSDLARLSDSSTERILAGVLTAIEEILAVRTIVLNVASNMRQLSPTELESLKAFANSGKAALARQALSAHLGTGTTTEPPHA